MSEASYLHSELFSSIREGLFHLPNSSVSEASVWNSEPIADLARLEEQFNAMGQIAFDEYKSPALRLTEIRLLLREKHTSGERSR